MYEKAVSIYQRQVMEIKPMINTLLSTMTWDMIRRVREDPQEISSSDIKLEPRSISVFEG